MNKFLFPIFCILYVFAFTSCTSSGPENPDQEEWIPLFNGKDIKQWTPKIVDQRLGQDIKRYFTVQDSFLTVQYEVQDTFDGKFGHLFYRNPYSYYRLKASYRFFGDQQVGGPAWAYRNNGLMLHCQPPKTMDKDQGFPSSLELQLLGGYPDGRERTNLNLCTPGTHVYLADTLETEHCINSNYPATPGDDWVDVEAMVYGDSLIQHLINGKVVFEFTKPIIGGGYGPEKYLSEGDKVLSGYIAIQAETHPIQFKSIELLDLCGCMDKKAKNYKSYFVKADNEKCIY